MEFEVFVYQQVKHRLTIKADSPEAALAVVQDAGVGAWGDHGTTVVGDRIEVFGPEDDEPALIRDNGYAAIQG